LIGTGALADLARFVESAAEVRHRDDELLYNFGDAVVAQRGSLDADDVARVLRSHAMLGFRNDRLLAELQDQLFGLMQQSRATASGLSGSVRGLARLEQLGLAQRPPPELLESVARMVTEHLAFFKPTDLCDVLEAYSLYRIQSDAQTSQLLLAIGGVLGRSAGDLSAAQCASSVRAFAKCRVHDERLLSAVANRLREAGVRGRLNSAEVAWTLYGFAKFSSHDTALMDLLSIEARRNLHHMDLPQVSSVLASLGKANVHSPVLTSRAAVRLRRFPSEDLDAAPLNDLSALAMAFGKLQVYDKPLFEALAQAFLRRGVRLFVQEPCSMLVQLTHAFTKVHIMHSELFAAIAAVLFERFSELTLLDITKYLHGLAKVDYNLPPRLRERLEDGIEAQAKGAASLGVFELLKLASSARRLGLAVPAVDARVKAVLPYEPAGGEISGPPRRPTPPKRRRQSARKRKWTW